MKKLITVLTILQITQYTVSKEPPCHVSNCQVCYKYDSHSCYRCKIGYEEEYNSDLKATSCKRMVVSIVGMALSLVFVIAIVTLCVSYFNSVNSRKLRKGKSTSVRGEAYSRPIDVEGKEAVKEKLKRKLEKERKEEELLRRESQRMSAILDRLGNVYEKDLERKQRNSDLQLVASPEPKYVSLGQDGLYVISEEQGEPWRASYQSSSDIRKQMQSVISARTRQSGYSENLPL